MKHVFVILCLGVSTTQLKAQTVSQTPDGSSNSETESAYTGYVVNNNVPALPNSTSGGVTGNPYFSKDWVNGSITTGDNKVISQDLVFMYNKVDGRLFLKKSESAVILQADPAKITSFTLITDRPHTFVRTDAFTKEYSGNFYEVLVRDEKKYSLLKLTTAEFQENTTAAASNVMTVTSSAGSFSDKVKYYICKDGQLTQVSLKKKSFQSTIASDKDKAEKYFQEHSGSFNEDAAIGLITEINAQVE